MRISFNAIFLSIFNVLSLENIVLLVLLDFWYLLFTTQDPNLFWDLPKNEISRRSFMKIFTRSHSSEDRRWISSENLLKIFRRKDFMKILFKTFSSKNLLKIFINFLWKIFSQFLHKIFLRSLKDLQLKSFGDLCKILSSNLLEIFRRSSSEIFLRSTENLLVFFLIFSLKKNLKIFVKWSKMDRRSSEDLLIKSSVNLLINLQKIFLRSHEDLKKNLLEDLLKISKRTLNEIFLISRRRWASYLRRGS